MKVLYCTDPQLDYLADQIYDGLCAVLGWQNVFDFPPKAAYHDPGERVSYLAQNPGHEYGMEDVVGVIRDQSVDLAIVSSPRQGAVKAYRLLAERVRTPPVVILDGEDDRHIRAELAQSIGAALYFKREVKLGVLDEARGHFKWRGWLGNARSALRTHPLPFSVTGASLKPVPELDRDIDVSFVGRASHRNRVRAVRLLKQATDLHFEGGFYVDPSDRASKVAESWFGRMAAKLIGDPPARDSIRKIPPEAHLAMLHRSKTAVSVRGGGFDTMRYWEIVAAKTPLISERPDIEIPNNFEHGVHAIFCRPDLRDLPEWVRYLKNNEAERRRMADAAFAHLLAYHTTARRATYLIDLCGGAI